MENKKTIEYLNGKMWYRLLKVVFGFIVLASILIFNGWIIEEGLIRLDNHKTLITCTYGEKKTFTPKQIDINLPTYQFKNEFNYKNFFETYNDYYIEAIFKNCYQPTNDNIDVYAAQKVYEVWGNDRLSIKKDDRPPLTETEKQYLDELIPKIEVAYGSGKTQYLNYSVQLFDIKPVYTYAEFIKLFLLGNFVILFISEMLRRIFYYIVLGKIRPEK